MLRMFATLVLSCCLFTSARAAELNSLTPAELADGWILLFDGKTLFGWEPTTKANWQVAEGAISVSEGSAGFLNTTSQFANYELLVDFRAPAETNSGVFLYNPAAPANAATDCYELNIADEKISPFPTGSFVGRQKASSYALATEWQTFRVTALNGKFTVLLNGQPVLDYTDPKPLGRGAIGLQFRNGKVEFRNLKLRPLGLQSLFNGRDLTGWKTYPEMKSVFSVTATGELNVKDGKGQLESTGQYGDFCAQWDVFANGKHLNSGVFFRCVPGSTMDGYECQIQNGFKDDDRAQPLDCGTGGFYRRQNARFVLGDDFQWVPMTLVVSDTHMAAWVRGVQVSDWTDPRKPDDNPRKGSRTAAGTLMIQGHDPTTDLSFRRLGIAPLPAR